MGGIGHGGINAQHAFRVATLAAKLGETRNVNPGEEAIIEARAQSIYGDDQHVPLRGGRSQGRTGRG
jgi:hypothetical protein